MAIVVALAGVQSPANANLSTSPDDGWLAEWLPEVSASSALTTAPAVSGSVMLPGGQVPAAGAAVHLAAWPPEEVIAGMEEGDPLHLTPLAKTVADADGNYTLRIDPAVDTTPLWSQAGTMDVDVVASLGGEAVTYSFSLVPEASADEEGDPLTAQVDARTGEVATAMRVDVELGYPERAQVAGSVDTAVDEISDRQFTANDAGGIYQPMNHGLCPGGTGLKQNYGARRVRLGGIHTIGGGREMRFTYTGSASSTLGVGVSTSGAAGSFSASGTVSRSRTESVSFGWYTASTNLAMETYFSYGRYCVNQNQGGPPGAHHHYYAVRAIRHEGGSNTPALSSFISSFCIPYAANTGGSKENTNAVTWSAGAQTSGVIDINLSTRTGFTSSAKVEYRFATAGRLCGANDLPSGSPGRLRMLGPW